MSLNLSSPDVSTPDHTGSSTSVQCSDGRGSLSRLRHRTLAYGVARSDLNNAAETHVTSDQVRSVIEKLKDTKKDK